MLECTGRLQKCRLYAMSDNKAFRATVSYLIVRDLAHEKVFAKALESLGVNWIRHFQFRRPRLKKCLNTRVGNEEPYTISNGHYNDKSGLGDIFNGESPFGDGDVKALDRIPEGLDIPQNARSSTRIFPGWIVN